MERLQGSETTEEKVAAAEAAAAAALHVIDALDAAAATEAAAALHGMDGMDAAATATTVLPLPKRPAEPGALQQAKRRVVPVDTDAPIAAPVPAVMPAQGDRSKEALHTPRTKLLPAPTQPWEWSPRRVNADAAPTGPNGLKEACGLKADEVTVIMCTVHVQREVTKHKGDFTDPDNVSKMNHDIERLRCTTITPALAAAGKRLLKEKFLQAGEPAAAAYFTNVWLSKNITYAEANATLPNEPTDRVVGGVPPQSNAIERKNLSQKAVRSGPTTPLRTWLGYFIDLRASWLQERGWKREGCTQFLGSAFKQLQGESMKDLNFNSSMPRGNPSPP
jgi:hypothetical protein